MKRILYVEDDESLAYLTSDNLQQSGYEVDHFNNGITALQRFKKDRFDICLLDIMVPKLDGFALAQEIRKINHHIPILFLSAKTLKEDRIKGLRIGADDYILKPFSIEELILKLEVFLTRAKKENGNLMRFKIGKFDFDPGNFLLKSESSEPIKMTQKEAELLKLFLQNKNQVLKREQILVSLWGEDDYFMGRSLDVFISRLRKIFAEEPAIKIENIHSVGFRFNDITVP